MILLLKVAYNDWKRRKIDNRSCVFILLLTIMDMGSSADIAFLERMVGGVIVAAPMLLLTIIVPGAFGGGDIKLMAASGLLLGKTRIVYAMVIAIFVAGVYGSVMLFMGRYKRKDKFAFGPFLVIGLFCAVLLL